MLLNAHHDRLVPPPSPSIAGSDFGINNPSSENLIPPDSPQVPNDTDGRGSKHVPKVRDRIIAVWWYELFCGFLVVASLAAIAIIGFIFDGRALPTWPFGLSINALVAVFSAIIKASIGLVVSEGLGHLKWTSLETPQRLFTFDVYDDASRGPWGAARFLRHFGLKPSSFIPSVGAIITLLLLPIDPFTQQIMQVRDCQSHSSSDALLPRAQVVDFGGNASNFTLNSLKNAVYQGVFADVQPHANYRCVGSSCSFPDSTSIAMCSSCSDVTDRILKTSSMDNETVNEWTIWKSNNSVVLTLPGSYRNVSVQADKEGMGLADGRAYYDISETTKFSMTLDSPSMGAVDDADRVVLRGDDMNPVRNISMIRLDTEKLRGLTDEGKLHAEISGTAFTCSLEPCVRNFKSSFANNSFSESSSVLTALHGHWANSSQVSLAVADLDCVDGSDRSQRLDLLRRLGYSISDPPSQWLPYNVTFQPNAEGYEWNRYNYTNAEIYPEAHDLFEPVLGDLSESYVRLTEEALEAVPKECIYQLDPFAYLAILGQFEYEFNGSFAYDGSSLITAAYNTGSGNLTFEDVEALMRRITDDLTVVIRGNAIPFGTFNAPTIGFSTSQTACVAVQWPWITYFVVLLALFFCFFIGFIVQSRLAQSRLSNSYRIDEHGDPKFSKGVKPSYHDFKASELPVLFHGLDGAFLEKGPLMSEQEPNRVSQLERVAKEMLVRLVPTEEGWKIVKVDEEVSQSRNNDDPRREDRGGEIELRETSFGKYFRPQPRKSQVNVDVAEIS